jgi:hypothetical protein
VTALTPLDDGLWQMTRVAVEAAGAAADTHLAAGGWRPRLALPSVEAFDSGWPNLHRERLFPPDTAPTDLARLFGPTRDALVPFAYADVPELVSLIDYVRDREDLRVRATVPTVTGNRELEGRMLQYEVVDLALSVLSRARATGAESGEALLAIYLQRERAWLLDPLPVEYLVPFALTAFDLDSTLVIDDSTRIELMDAATQSARAPSGSGIESVPRTVVGAATHCLVLAGSSLANPGPGPRLFGPPSGEPLPLEDADLVCQVLRVLTHIDVGYAQIVQRPVGWADGWTHALPALTTVGTVRRYPERFDNYAWLRPAQPIPGDALSRLPATVTALRTAPSNVTLAARRLSLAALRDADDDRTVDACIGLEALLGDGRDELSHRLALRAAAVLGTSPHGPADPHAVYGIVKKVYAHRSAVVHGTQANKTRTVTLNDVTYATSTVAVMVLRDLLTDALSRPGSWTPKTLDSLILTSLAPPAETAPGTAESGGASADAHQ